MLNNDCKYMIMIIIKFKKILDYWYFNLIMKDISKKYFFFFKEVYKNSSYDICYYIYKIYCMFIYFWFVLIIVLE